jgi:hypothetical protein
MSTANLTTSSELVYWRAVPAQQTEADRFGSFGCTLRYLRALGTVTQLEGLRGYIGGMDTSPSRTDGKYILLYRSHSLQVRCLPL